jgi:hypothetical protein
MQYNYCLPIFTIIEPCKELNSMGGSKVKAQCTYQEKEQLSRFSVFGNIYIENEQKNLS